MNLYAGPEHQARAWMAMLACAGLAFLVGCSRQDAGNPAAASREETDRIRLSYTNKITGLVTNVVTGDIQAGIEKHIAAESARNGGTFNFATGSTNLQLTLVRVHVEYLATLSPQHHFACVDMVGKDGQFYDIDFFLEGDPGDMKVTETTVHKINGKPLYLWKQAPDRTWYRATVDKASDELLGIRNGRDAFVFRYHATLPDIDGDARMWIPLADSDAFQQVEVLSQKVPGRTRMLKDAVYGNRIVFSELGAAESGQEVEIVYRVERREKGAYPGDAAEAARFLEPERRSPLTEQIRSVATNAVAGKQGDLMKARALYDLVMGAMDYKKFGEGWGQGDAVYACSAQYGNCTDFHAYFTALARAAGIPARFAIGAAIPSERNDGGTDGYHCWAEFFAEGKWWPVDISEANKFSALSMYYFGHHPANRFELSRGRDLVVDPAPASGPINFLAYPLVEVNGKPIKAKVLFTFQRLQPCAA